MSARDILGDKIEEIFGEISGGLTMGINKELADRLIRALNEGGFAIVPIPNTGLERV